MIHKLSSKRNFVIISQQLSSSTRVDYTCMCNLPFFCSLRNITSVDDFHSVKFQVQTESSSSNRRYCHILSILVSSVTFQSMIQECDARRVDSQLSAEGWRTKKMTHRM